MKHWALIDNRTAELVGVSSEAQAQEAFEAECAETVPDWQRVRVFHTIREATGNEIHRVAGEFEWTTAALDLRKRAMASPTKPPPAPEVGVFDAAVGRWSVTLFYFETGPSGAYFRGKFKPEHPALLGYQQEIAHVMSLLVILGCNVPAIMHPSPVDDGLIFEWPASDRLEIEGTLIT